MFKKNILFLLVMCGVSLSMMGAQKPSEQVSSEQVRLTSIQSHMNHNEFLNNQDQYIKYVSLLFPTMIISVTMFKVLKGSLSSDERALSLVGGLASGLFSMFMTTLISNTQEVRNNTITKLRAELANSK